MKITESRLRQIIREEVKRSFVNENEERDSAAKSLLGVDDKHYADLKKQDMEITTLLTQKQGIERKLEQAASESGLPEEKIKELGQSAMRMVKDNYSGYSAEELEKLGRLSVTAQPDGGSIRTGSGKKVQAKAYSNLRDAGKLARVHLKFLDDKGSEANLVVFVR